MLAHNPRGIRNSVLHPVVILMMLLYVANNHIFQVLWPSPLTGKISGFAWLFFAPIIAFGFAALVLPRAVAGAKALPAVMGLGVGAVYALVKTVPAFNYAIREMIEQTFGIPVAILVDPTDLVALAALPISVLFVGRPRLPLRRSTTASCILVLGMATVFTLADAAQADYGIACLETQDGALVASSRYHGYASEDGGATWALHSDWIECEWDPYYQESAVKEEGDKQLRVRFAPAAPIEVSDDGGATWLVEYEPKAGTQAQRAFYEKYRHGSPVFQEGPLDAVIDSSSGNLVLAMGHEGVLIRKPDGTWQWAPVGVYQRVSFSSPGFVRLLAGEILLAVANGLLVFSFLGMKRSRENRKHVGRTVFVVLCWIALAIVMFAFPPAVSPRYEATVPNLTIPLVLFILVIVTATTVVKMRRDVPLMRRLLLYAVVGAVLFLAPYLMWLINLLPVYHFAAVLAAAVHVGTIVRGLRAFPEPPAPPAADPAPSGGA